MDVWEEHSPRRSPQGKNSEAEDYQAQRSALSEGVRVNISESCARSGGGGGWVIASPTGELVARKRFQGPKGKPDDYFINFISFRLYKWKFFL